MVPEIAEKNDELWLRLQYKVSEKQIAETFDLFLQNGIEPILIKGWAVSLFYPDGWKRISTDIDLCVNPEIYPEAEKVFRSEKGRSLGIDLHKGFRQLDTLSWEDLFANSQIVELEGTKARILCPEDHLRILCVHWLIDGGGYKEKLRDIYYLVENHKPDFDWERCLESVSKIRRRWIICTIGLAHKYLDLNLENTPIEAEAKDLPKWLIKAVEKEWKSDVRLTDLYNSTNDPKRFFQQLKKRIPPNPIQSTIETEGDFDKGFRIYYQILNIFQRTFRSVKKRIRSERN